ERAGATERTRSRVDGRVRALAYARAAPYGGPRAEGTPMRWRQGRESENVEDERGAGGGGVGVPGGGMRIGLGGLLLVVVGAWLFGADPMTLLQLLGGGVTTQSPDGGYAQPAPREAGAPQDEGAEFVSKVLASTEDTWGDIFQRGGSQYKPPKLVLFSEV